jgi:FkbM family methyltransferase
MILLIKKILFKICGQQTYLKLLHHGFYFLFDNGFLKNDTIYKYHYFVKNIIKPGDTVVDIGANLGYYTKNLSRLVGAQGKVIGIEPMVPYYNILNWALGKKSEVVIHNVALGNEEGKIRFALPKSKTTMHTGLPHVATETDTDDNSTFFDVKVTRASQLLASIKSIAYIKIDIEGYESVVIPEMKEVIAKHLPIVQVETWSPQREIVDETLVSLDYKRYTLYKGKLTQEDVINVEFGDYLYVPPQKLALIKDWIA